MNKIILSALFAISAISVKAHAEFDQDLFEKVAPDAHDKLSISDYQEVANFFKIYMFPVDPERDSETNFLNYRLDEKKGVIYQIAVYGDGYIVTQMNGSMKGQQTVVRNDEIIGLSYPYENRRHKYSWGSVYTSSRFQVVNRE